MTFALQFHRTHLDIAEMRGAVGTPRPTFAGFDLGIFDHV
jgi:hypothetical protein